MTISDFLMKLKAEMALERPDVPDKTPQELEILAGKNFNADPDPDVDLSDINTEEAEEENKLMRKKPVKRFAWGVEETDELKK